MSTSAAVTLLCAKWRYDGRSPRGAHSSDHSYAEFTDGHDAEARVRHAGDGSVGEARHNSSASLGAHASGTDDFGDVELGAVVLRNDSPRTPTAAPPAQ